MTKSIYIRKKEVATKLGVSESTVYRWEKLGNIPNSFKMGPNRVVWDLRELEECILLKKQDTNL